MVQGQMMAAVLGFCVCEGGAVSLAQIMIAALLIHITPRPGT